MSRDEQIARLEATVQALESALVRLIREMNRRDEEFLGLLQIAQHQQMETE